MRWCNVACAWCWLTVTVHSVRCDQDVARSAGAVCEVHGHALGRLLVAAELLIPADVQVRGEPVPQVRAIGADHFLGLGRLDAHLPLSRLRVPHTHLRIQLQRVEMADGLERGEIV